MHKRTQCGLHAFDVQPNVSNAAHCHHVGFQSSNDSQTARHCADRKFIEIDCRSRGTTRISMLLAKMHGAITIYAVRADILASPYSQCFCWVCDMLASKCSFWGQGDIFLYTLRTYSASCYCNRRNCLRIAFTPRPLSVVIKCRAGSCLNRTGSPQSGGNLRADHNLCV
jgi:hypothetical protein